MYPVAEFLIKIVPIQGVPMPFRLLIVFCLCTSSAFSQSEMQKLAAVFSGRWTISDKSEPSPQYPNGLTRSGEELWYTLAGGTPLIEEYHSKSPAGTDEHDTAAFWWDATAHKYVGLFCADFVDQGCALFDIVWQTSGHLRVGKDNGPFSEAQKQDQIIMSGEYLQNGRKYAWREIFVFATTTTFTQTLFLGEEGHELKRAAVISANRISRAR
jgi:hypothetical protein